MWGGVAAVAPCGDHSLDAGSDDLLADGIGIIAPISQECLDPVAHHAEQRGEEERIAVERERRGERPSANTRMGQRPVAAYRDGVREYRPRTAHEVIDARRRGRVSRKRITSAAEIGPRLHQNLEMIALRCAEERRGDG